MKLSDLKEAPYNPRQISDEALNGLKISLDRFGDLSGITFNTRTGHLVAGHQRIKALREEYGDIEFDGEKIVTPDGKEFRVRFVDWDESKEKAANIAANSETITGEFTDDVQGLLEEIRLSMDDLYDGLHFDKIEIPEVDFDVNKVEEDDFDVQSELDKISKPKSKRGDLYQLGRHRLLCGDSTGPTDIGKLMDGDKARLIFTDPPYNVDYKSPGGLSYNSKKFGGSGGKIFNDNKSDGECLQFYTDVLINLYENSTDDVTIYWWFANRNNAINRAAFEAANWHMSQIIIWLKNSFVFSRGQDYHRMYEPCMLGWKKGKKHFRTRGLNNFSDVFNLEFDDFVEQFDVWYEKRDNTAKYVHPTQKPVRLPERALKKNSIKNDIVLDVFGGSGSTMIACEQLSRKCYSMELDPKFVDVIVTRYVKYTGNKNIMLNGKEIIWDASGEEQI